MSSPFVHERDEEYDEELETPPRKRQRHSQRHDNDSDDEPILPDSYLRSPDSRQSNRQPGAIVRVTLTNFVTYTKAEFHPGPNLNMVIGPNGTGKSTLVCAICLGLGWDPKYLGRAKDIGEFVKHGQAQARIEIELARRPGQPSNPIITTKLHKKGNKAEYMLQGKESSKKSVKQLAESFSIQVDNLCQFLPQDRVVEFSRLSPVELLAQTQSAAAPAHMTDWHQELKTLGKELKREQRQHEDLTGVLTNLQNRQRAQESDVQRIREHSTLEGRLNALEKIKPFPQYSEKKDEYTLAKKKLRRSRREYDSLQTQLEPNLRAVNDKAEYLKAVRSAVQAKTRLTTRMGTEATKICANYDRIQAEIAGLMARHDQDKNNQKAIRLNITKYKREIQKTKDDMKNVPPIVDFAAMNAGIREDSRTINSIDTQLQNIRDKVNELSRDQNSRTHEISEKETQREVMNTQAGQLENRLRRQSDKTADAWAWIQENTHRFEAPIYGPPMITCNVTERALVPAVEQTIGRNGLLSITTTNRADFNLAQSELLDKRGWDVFLKCILTDRDSFQPPCSEEVLREYSMDGWLIDIVEGPAPVLAMLCDNHGLDSCAYSRRPLSPQQLDKLNASQLTNFVDPKTITSITRRREYGSRGFSSSIRNLGNAYAFVDMPINHDQERHLVARIRDLREECESIEHEIMLEKAKITQLKGSREQADNQKKRKENDKTESQRLKTTFEGLPTLLAGLEEKLQDDLEKIARFEETTRQHDHAVDDLHIKRGQLAIDYANSVERHRVMHLDLLHMEVLQIEAESDSRQFEDRVKSDRELLEQHRQEIEDFTKITETLLDQARALQDRCKAIFDDFSDSEKLIHEEFQTTTTEQLEAEIQSTIARLEMNTGGNHSILREFEQRAKQITQKQNDIEKAQHEMDSLEQKITSVREQWEPQLDAIIAKISASFAENFASIQCAGEVDLYKDEDFDQWAIQIKVKFRESEPLSLLDSHRQSGGERAVSTIFYLMALQSLARAPFRVVDEINQGMDPRNERLVHSRLVNIACQAARPDGSGGSQYFLITPKLLTGLEYHPNMKIHCIASGEYMPKDHSALDFGKLAKHALTLRAGPA